MIGEVPSVDWLQYTAAIISNNVITISSKARHGACGCINKPDRFPDWISYKPIKSGFMFTSHNRSSRDCGSTELRFARLCIALWPHNRAIVACVSCFVLMTQTEN